MNPLIVLQKIRQAGGEVLVEAGDLRVSCQTGILSEEDKQVLTEHKLELIKILPPEPVREATRPERWSNDLTDEENQDLDQFLYEDPVECSECGQIIAWWDAWGVRHCQHCEPPIRSELLQKLAALLRQRQQWIGARP